MSRGNNTIQQALRPACAPLSSPTLLPAVRTRRCNNPRPGDSPLALEREVEALAEQLAAANPTPDAALSPLLLGSWALLHSGRSRRLAAAAGMPAAAGPSLQQALQAASDRLYSLFYECE